MKLFQMKEITKMYLNYELIIYYNLYKLILLQKS